MGITWEEAEVAAQNRSEWRQSVAQCIHLDPGWIKVKVKVRWLLHCILLFVSNPYRNSNAFCQFDIGLKNDVCQQWMDGGL